MYLASNTRLFTASSKFKFFICLINAHHHVITPASFFARRSELRTVHISNAASCFNQWESFLRSHDISDRFDQSDTGSVSTLQHVTCMHVHVNQLQSTEWPWMILEGLTVKPAGIATHWTVPQWIQAVEIKQTLQKAKMMLSVTSATVVESVRLELLGYFDN